jgi:hypothetical protein
MFKAFNGEIDTAKTRFSGENGLGDKDFRLVSNG